MNNPTEVDRSAPVVAHHEIVIAADLDRVWELHIDVNAWPTWQTDIDVAHIDGVFEPGNSFDWSSYGFGVTSTIYLVDKHSRVLWGGTAGGITGIHEWTFNDSSDGVRVTTTESFAGRLVEADVSGMQATLDASLVAWLRHLKGASEAHRPDGNGLVP